MDVPLFFGGEIEGYNLLDHPGLIAAFLFLAVFGGAAWIVGKYRLDANIACMLMMQFAFIPFMTWLTWMSFEHPERLVNQPQMDMRNKWPLLVGLQAIAIIAWRMVMLHPARRALRWLKYANELLAQGRVKEADAADTKGVRFLAQAKKEMKC